MQRSTSLLRGKTSALLAHRHLHPPSTLRSSLALYPYLAHLPPSTPLSTLSSARSVPGATSTTARSALGAASSTMSRLSRSPSSASTPLIPQLLGFGGLVPFVATAAFTALPEYQSLALHLQSSYSCSILSFLGAVHWGVALKASATSSARISALDLIWGVIPSLTAAGAGSLIPRDALVILMPSYAAVWGYDRLRFRVSTGAVPPWYLMLRKRLTIGASLCMLFAFLSPKYSSSLTGDRPVTSERMGIEKLASAATASSGDGDFEIPTIDITAETEEAQPQQ